MFTIQATVEKIYKLHSSKQHLFEFFANPLNFARYMPDIINSVDVKTPENSIWNLKIELTPGSYINIQLEMIKKLVGQGLIKHFPVNETHDNLGISIKLAEQSINTEIDFNLDLKLQRKSSFDIHPLAGFLGERAINKIVAGRAEEYVDNFVNKATEQKHKK
jgi:hypothetical protein